MAAAQEESDPQREDEVLEDLEDAMRRSNLAASDELWVKWEGNPARWRCFNRPVEGSTTRQPGAPSSPRNCSPRAG